MQALFQLDAQGDDYLKQLAGFLGESTEDREVLDYADALSRGAWARRVRIDGLIREVSEHWSIDRMAAVDRSILRVAVFEMLQASGDPPVAVAIDEAIELGKQFGEAEAPQFINGILDAVRKRLGSEGGESGAGAGPEAPPIPTEASD